MGETSGNRESIGTGTAPVPATLVLGLGNPLRGDDGVGVRVAQHLAKAYLPGDVDVVDGGTRGLGLVSLLEGRQRAIVVDAADMGKAPGQVVRFVLEDARLLGEDEGQFSIHAAGLREALLLARALGILPQEVVFFGVQPARIAWETGLSPQVEAALPSLVEVVWREVMVAGPPRETS